MTGHEDQIFEDCQSSFAYVCRAIEKLCAKQPSLVMKDPVMLALRNAVLPSENIDNLSLYQEFEIVAEQMYVPPGEADNVESWYNAMAAIEEEINLVLGEELLEEDDIENTLLYLRLITLKSAVNVCAQQGLPVPVAIEIEQISKLRRQIIDGFGLSPQWIDMFVNPGRDVDTLLHPEHDA